MFALWLCALAGVATSAQAFDYLWLAPADQGQSHAWLGNLNGSRQPPVADSVQASAQGTAELKVTVQDDHWLLDAAPAGSDIRLKAQRVLADGSLNYYQARLGRHETQAHNDLELVPVTPNSNIFKLLWKGAAVAATQVNVSTSAGWIRTLKPQADGTVMLETPFSGLYVLEVTAKVNASTTLNGRKYDDVRHTATLSFIVE